MQHRFRDSPQDPDDKKELQGKPIHIPRAELPPSWWSSIGDRDEFWRLNHDETFGFIALGAFNDGSKLGISTANHIYGEVDPPGFPDWDYVNGEMERDVDFVPKYGAFPPNILDPHTYQGEDSPDVSQMPPESLTGSAAGQKAMQTLSRTSVKTDSHFMPWSPNDLGRQTSNLSVPLPRVVVSGAALNSNGVGGTCSVPKIYANTSFMTTPFHVKQNVGHNLHKSDASSNEGSRLLDWNQHHPSNYQSAMHERYPSPTVIREDEPKYGSLIAERVSAFNADVDSITAQVAAGSDTDEILSGKRRRVSRDLSTLQIPLQPPSWSQGWQVPPADVLCHPKRWNGLQTLPYPTPTSSGGTTMYSRGDTTFIRDDTPSSQTTPSCVSALALSSPISPSPSNLSDAADGITRCSSCPEKVFTGTPKDQKNNLHRHMRDAHKGMPRLQCLVPECNTSFSAGRKDNLMKHVRAMHPDFPLPIPSMKRKRKADSDSEPY